MSVRDQDGWRDLDTPEDAAALDAAHARMFPPTPAHRLPGSVAAAIRKTQWPEPALDEVGRGVIRNTFMEALGDWIDARIDYRAADPEWRSYRDGREAEERLEKALQDVLRHG